MPEKQFVRWASPGSSDGTIKGTSLPLVKSFFMKYHKIFHFSGKKLKVWEITCWKNTKPHPIIIALRHFPWKISLKPTCFSGSIYDSSSRIKLTWSETKSGEAWPLNRHKHRVAISFVSGRFPFPCMAHNRSHLGDEGNQHIPTPITRHNGVLVAYI